MSRSKEQLLELTRSALWGSEPDTSLFEEGVNWAEVLQLANEQTLQGVVSAAIERLPLALRPSRTEGLKLHQIVSLNRQQRRHQIEVLAKLLELVARAGVERPVLLKGLGVGLNYPDPSLRMCGDIDLYVGEKHYFKVWDFVCEELGVEKEESHSVHHFDFEFMGTSIEIHRYATAPNSVAVHSREFMAWSVEQLEGSLVREVSIDGVKVYLPPYNFDFIYIFYHTWRHFLMGGVGLRQVCDWGCYASMFADRVDRAEVERLVELFRLEKPLSLFASIAVQALGVAPEKFIGFASSESELYESAVERVWNRGNFGKYNVDLQRRSKGFITRKFLGSIAMMGDMWYLMKIDWHYALRFYRLSFMRSVRSALKGV